MTKVTYYRNSVGRKRYYRRYNNGYNRYYLKRYKTIKAQRKYFSARVETLFDVCTQVIEFEEQDRTVWGFRTITDVSQGGPLAFKSKVTLGDLLNAPSIRQRMLKLASMYNMYRITGVKFIFTPTESGTRDQKVACAMCFTESAIDGGHFITYPQVIAVNNCATLSQKAPVKRYFPIKLGGGLGGYVRTEVYDVFNGLGNFYAACKLDIETERPHYFDAGSDTCVNGSIKFIVYIRCKDCIL